MTLQEIRVSGLLEQYVIGSLDLESIAIVEESIVENPQLLVDIEEIGNAIQQYIKLYSKEISPLLKEKIINSLNSAPTVEPTRRLVSKSNKSSPKSINKKKSSPNQTTAVLKYLGYGLAALFLISTIGMWMKSNSSSETFTREKSQLSSQLEQSTAEIAALKDELSSLKEMIDPNNQIYHMVPNYRHPQARLYIINQPSFNKQYIHAKDLPEVPNGSTMQIWIIGEDGSYSLGPKMPPITDFLIPLEIDMDSNGLVVSIENTVTQTRPNRRGIIGSFNF